MIKATPFRMIKSIVLTFSMIFIFALGFAQKGTDPIQVTDLLQVRAINSENK